MATKYVVTLTEEERDSLRRLVSCGRAAARKLAHARILLQADRGPSGRGGTTGASSTGTARPGSSPSLAASRRRAGAAGPCGCWPSNWWCWRWWTRCRTSACGRRLKKRT